jgi:hypothetical protein
LKGCRYISAMRVLPKPVPASTKVCSEWTRWLTASIYPSLASSP